jgi:hypothetical protein
LFSLTCGIHFQKKEYVLLEQLGAEPPVLASLNVLWLAPIISGTQKIQAGEHRKKPDARAALPVYRDFSYWAYDSLFRCIYLQKPETGSGLHIF